MPPKRNKGTARRARGIFADTGGWYALVDESDPDHLRARDWFKQNRLPLITTDYILDEALTLLRTSLGHRTAVRFGEKLLASRLAQLISVTKEDKERAWEIFRRYDDKVLSFTDCTSFAVMERLGIDTAFTVDHDFESLGYIMVPS
ncbi:PIN domain-containing protein [Candidatus Bipolaricaulota bacterium]|nr:PIN domain-containing protein [Candidatus Bipolaricaulota bacterium]